MEKGSGSGSKDDTKNKEEKEASETESQEEKTKTPKEKPSKEKAENNGNSVQGRWNKHEHERFIEAIKKFGKDWKTVEQYIETRSGSQIRSHAQKFFNRIIKKYGIDKTEVISFIQNNYESEESSESTTPHKRKKTDRENPANEGDPMQVPSFQIKTSQQPKPSKDQPSSGLVAGSSSANPTKVKSQPQRGDSSSMLLGLRDPLDAHRSVSGEGSAQSANENQHSSSKNNSFRKSDLTTAWSSQINMMLTLANQYAGELNSERSLIF